MELTDILTNEYKCGKLRFRPVDLLLIVCTVLFGMLLRSTVWNIGGVAESEVSILGSIEKSAKALGICADLALALMGSLYVRSLTGNRTKALLTFSVFFLLPVYVMSSVMWGTADSLYLCLLAGVLFLLQKRKLLPAALFYGLAVWLGNGGLLLLPVLSAFFLPEGLFAGKESFESNNKQKREASVLLPFFCLLATALAGGLLRWYLISRSPGSFLQTAAEALIKKARPTELLSYNYPNLYQLLGPDAFVSEYGSLFPVIAASAGIALFIFAVAERKKKSEDPQLVFLKTALIASLILPFLLPGMDERAGLVSVMLSIFLAMKKPYYLYYAIATSIFSFMAGAAFFRGESFLPLSLAALAQLLMILHLCCAGKKDSPKADPSK